jgi:hypothetical protein
MPNDLDRSFSANSPHGFATGRIDVHNLSQKSPRKIPRLAHPGIVLAGGRNVAGARPSDHNSPIM